MAGQSTTVSIKLSGDRDVAQMLRNVGLNVSNLRPAMKDTGDYLKGFFGGEVFASRGQVIGEPWPRLSEPYASYKARFYRKGVLVATGKMQKSFNYTTTNTSVTIGNRDEKFEYHQAGTRKMPQRMMMKIDQQRYDMVVGIIERRLADTVAKNGGA